ncbi:FAD-binding type 2, partial [Penicillium longicatenatum]|uniref:FAD-binding type 2 n=1 Tax=Penicillium longicatenatum TaxID=1561947 RepID=UPI002547213B
SDSFSASPDCKTSPSDSNWQSTYEWNALSHTLQGTLLRNSPAASSCYPGNPFQSPENYTDSIDYPIYTNSSRLPPGATGYTNSRGFTIGGLSQYIVNATTEMQIATAMRWAFQRNILPPVHFRSPFGLTIKNAEHKPIWKLPGCNETADVMVLGSGNNWGSAGLAANIVNRAIAGGEDSTVGLGGLIQNGGHGWLSSHYGLESD